jgi:hypothetical protein
MESDCDLGRYIRMEQCAMDIYMEIELIKSQI